MPANLVRKRAILAGLETTYGKAATLTRANTVTMADYSPTPLEATTVERNLFRPYVGAASELIARRTTVLNPTCELVGGGMKAKGNAFEEKIPEKPQFHALLQACGMVETAVDESGDMLAAPTGDDAAKIRGWRYTTGDISKAKSVTIISQVDGIQQQIVGCRGTFVITCENAAIPTIAFTLTGRYAKPTETALDTTGTAPRDVPPVLFGSDNTAWNQVDTSPWGAIVPCVHALSVDCGHTITPRDCVKNDPGSGVDILITDRTSTGSVTTDARLDPVKIKEDGTTATFNPWNAAGSGIGTAVKEGVRTIDTVATPYGIVRHGLETGQWWTMGGADISIGNVTEEDRDGILAYAHPLRFAPVAPGNNDFTLTFWGKPVA